jgi:hypothetical protein
MRGRRLGARRTMPPLAGLRELRALQRNGWLKILSIFKPDKIQNFHTKVHNLNQFTRWLAFLNIRIQGPVSSVKAPLL